MLKVTFTRSHDTKTTWVYKEDDEVTPKIGSLYLKKPAAGELGNPEKLEVEIKAA